MINTQDNKKIWRDWKLWTLLTIAVVIIFGIAFTINNLSKETSSNNIEKYNMLGKEIKLTSKLKKELYKRVKEDITNSLKTPSSAIFPKMEEWNIRVNSNNVIEVKSYVDSQNSYGAMLRASFEQRYIYLNKDELICIYKEFNNETEFDITEDSQFSDVLNKRLNKTEVDKILRGSTIIYNKMSYKFDEEKQELTLEIIENENKSYNIRSGVYSCIRTEINQLFCMPVITLNIIVNNENGEKLAEVKGIDFTFLITEWNILAKSEIVYSPKNDEIEERLGQKLWQNDRIKNIDLKYIDTTKFYN